eukprot:1191581-Prorocentrum_minimum.AAC.1
MRFTGISARGDGESRAKGGGARGAGQGPEFTFGHMALARAGSFARLTPSYAPTYAPTDAPTCAPTDAHAATLTHPVTHMPPLLRTH